MGAVSMYMQRPTETMVGMEALLTEMTIEHVLAGDLRHAWQLCSSNEA